MCVVVYLMLIIDEFCTVAKTNQIFVNIRVMIVLWGLQ